MSATTPALTVLGNKGNGTFTADLRRDYPYPLNSAIATGLPSSSGSMITWLAVTLYWIESFYARMEGVQVIGAASPTTCVTPFFFISCSTISGLRWAACAGPCRSPCRPRRRCRCGGRG